MMTPEQIAERIVGDDRWSDIDCVGDDDIPVADIDRDALVRDIADLIRDYGAECARQERERCARAADANGIAGKTIARLLRSLRD